MADPEHTSKDRKLGLTIRRLVLHDRQHIAVLDRTPTLPFEVSPPLQIFNLKPNVPMKTPVQLLSAISHLVTITGNTADFDGSGRLRAGGRVTFSVNVTGNDSPGTSDTISISASNGYSVSGALANGDIRIQ